MDDLNLLLRFANEGSEQAFEELVRKHAPLVYSSARRRAGPECADDVAQAVFLILARKAAWLGRRKIANLSGWLFRATRYAASEARRAAARRAERERVAQERWPDMDAQSHSDPAADILPLLDAALDNLGRLDREAVLLRFFHNAAFAEIGASIGATEAAATRRVSRALDKLRAFLARRGRPVGVGALVTVLSAQAAEAIPAGLVSASATLATGAAAVAGSGGAMALAQATLQAMLLTHFKVAAATIGAALILVAGTTATLTVFEGDAHSLSQVVQFAGVESFPLHYRGAIRMPDGSIQHQLNLDGNRQTYFAPLGQEVRGFRLIRHQEKTVERSVPGLVDPLREDVSELTLQRGDREIVLIKGQTNAMPGEDCAHLVFRPEGTHRRLCVGEEFEAGDARFRVLSVSREPGRLVLRRVPDGREIVLKSARE